MAEIRFQVLNQANGAVSLDTFSGSGLAFYGASAGSSVQIGAFQDNTNVANADGSQFKDSTPNVKYVGSTYPSGVCRVSAAGGAVFDNGLSGVCSYQSTLGIEFGHTTAVKVQNCQMRIYDRTNINFPGTGVNTKAAEVINFNGNTASSAPIAQSSAGNASAAVGSGDCFWWGEPWPSEMVNTNPKFTNSSGEVFHNGVDTGTNVNGDSRLAAENVAGSFATVGGTGIIVPLSDSPGSGQQDLHKANQALATDGMLWPKWTQYVQSGKQATLFGSINSFGDGTTATNKRKNCGGTGVSTHHTWAVALSASPLSIGSKELYGLYVSLEYL